METATSKQTILINYPDGQIAYFPYFRLEDEEIHAEIKGGEPMWEAKLVSNRAEILRFRRMTLWRHTEETGWLGIDVWCGQGGIPTQVRNELPTVDNEILYHYTHFLAGDYKWFEPAEPMASILATFPFIEQGDTYAVEAGVDLFDLDEDGEEALYNAIVAACEANCGECCNMPVVCAKATVREKLASIGVSSFSEVREYGVHKIGLYDGSLERLEELARGVIMTLPMYIQEVTGKRFIEFKSGYGESDWLWLAED